MHFIPFTFLLLHLPLLSGILKAFVPALVTMVPAPSLSKQANACFTTSLRSVQMNFSPDNVRNTVKFSNPGACFIFPSR